MARRTAQEQLARNIAKANKKSRGAFGAQITDYKQDMDIFPDKLRRTTDGIMMDDLIREGAGIEKGSPKTNAEIRHQLARIAALSRNNEESAKHANRAFKMAGMAANQG